MHSNLTLEFKRLHHEDEVIRIRDKREMCYQSIDDDHDIYHREYFYTL